MRGLYLTPIEGLVLFCPELSEVEPLCSVGFWRGNIEDIRRDMSTILKRELPGFELASEEDLYRLQQSLLPAIGKIMSQAIYRSVDYRRLVKHWQQVRYRVSGVDLAVFPRSGTSLVYQLLLKGSTRLDPDHEYGNKRWEMEWCDCGEMGHRFYLFKIDDRK